MNKFFYNSCMSRDEIEWEYCKIKVYMTLQIIKNKNITILLIEDIEFCIFFLLNSININWKRKFIPKMLSESHVINYKNR